MLALWLNLALSIQFFEFGLFLELININSNDFMSVIGLIAIVGAISAFLFSVMIARFMVGVTLIKQPSTYLEKWLFSSVERQSRQLGIAMPQIGVFYASDLNAFTTGWGQKHAMFAVSSGLLESLDQDELEAVIGHELAHIENGDMVSLAIAQGIVVSLSLIPARLFGLLIDSFIFRRDSQGGFAYTIVYWLCMLVMCLLPHFIVMWFSRRREFSADKASALINGGEKMISALKRLANNGHHSLFTEQITALGIAGGVLEGLAGGMNSLRSIFSSHPPLKKRINAIQHQFIDV